MVSVVVLYSGTRKKGAGSKESESLGTSGKAVDFEN